MDVVTEQAAKPLPRLARRPAARTGVLRCCACFIFVVFAAPAYASVSLAPTATIPFEENQGQFDEQVAFAARTFDGTVFATHEGKIVYALSGGGPVGANDDSPLPPVAPTFGLALHETLVGATVTQVRGGEPTPTQVSYFIGNDPMRWHSGVPTFARVDLGEVYPGIWLQLVAHGNNVEKVFVVEPGAHPESIRLQIEGTERLSIGPWGDLQVDSEIGPVTFTAPVAYQPGDGRADRPVAVAYDVHGDQYGFAIRDYDHSRPLVIDPLLASTYIGGERSEESRGLALGQDGHIYIAGETRSPDFPTTPGTFQSEYPDCYINGFVSEFSSDLRFLLASTYICGSESDDAVDVAVDAEGNPMVLVHAGSADLPTTPGAYDTTFNGGGDVFVAKFDPGLTTLLASTYLGGAQQDEPVALALDADGNVYVSGNNTSGGFPTTEGAYDPTSNGQKNTFIAKLDGDLTTLLAATYLGGGYDINSALAVDELANVYTCGTTGGGFPTTAGAYDRTFNGTDDLYVAKLDTELTTLSAATYLGGWDEEVGFGMTTDASGHVYVGGETISPDFPTSPGAFDTTFDNGYVGFISKFDEQLSALLASTYYAGLATASGIVQRMQVSADGTLVAVGTTPRGGIVATPNSYNSTGSVGNENLFIARFDANLGKVLAATYFGSGVDWLGNMVLDGQGNVLLTGHSGSSYFPTTPGAFQQTAIYVELLDAFVSKLTPDLGAQPTYHHNGDVNADGRITSADAQWAFVLVLGLADSIPWQFYAADCNGDGTVSMADVQRIFWAGLASGACSEALPSWPPPDTRASESAGTVRTPRVPDSIIR